MLKLLGLFGGIKGKLAILGVASVVAFGAGWKVNGWRYDASMLKLQNELAEERKKTINRQFEVERLYAERARILEERNRDISRRIANYVPAGNMSAEWLREHDCQVRAPGQAACPPDGEITETYTDKDALIVVIENYQMCQRKLEERDALIDWIGALYD